MNRRQILTGLVGLVASPAIVRADSLMALRSTPVKFGPTYVTFSGVRFNSVVAGPIFTAAQMEAFNAAAKRIMDQYDMRGLFLQPTFYGASHAVHRS